jgi:uncharacterized damage-inducible protein DinB
MSDPRYPIGPWNPTPTPASGHVAGWIDEITLAPGALRKAVSGLQEAQLDTPYREGGWTVRQVVHHVPDSHLNAYSRCKLALTEDVPTIKPFDEALWAELADGKAGPVEPSLALLEHLHARWVRLLSSLTPAEFARTFVHPEHGRAMSLAQTVDLYAWHGRHHVAQITTLRAARGW